MISKPIYFTQNIEIIQWLSKRFYVGNYKIILFACFLEFNQMFQFSNERMGRGLGWGKYKKKKNSSQF